MLAIVMSTAPTMLIVPVEILINNSLLGDLSSNLNTRWGDLATTSTRDH
jgi:hypothetical protein